MSVKLIDFQLAQAEIQRELAKLRGNKYATVGIHEDAGNTEDGEMTQAQLGATLNFGADIDHPGGTRYTRTADGKARFISNDSTAPAIGVTGPHKINIPPRPWLIPGVESATPDVIDTIASGIEKGLATDQIMEQVGAIAAGATQQYMTDLREPPNAKSTIAKKGSDNPLIDSGSLRASVTYKVTSTKPDEGI